MVPSMSETMTWSSQLHRWMLPWQRHVPWYWVVMLKVTSLGPSLSLRLAYQDAATQLARESHFNTNNTNLNNMENTAVEFFQMLHSNTYINKTDVSYYLLR